VNSVSLAAALPPAARTPNVINHNHKMSHANQYGLIGRNQTILISGYALQANHRY
jgi:hypothetical protein